VQCVATARAQRAWGRRGQRALDAGMHRRMHVLATDVHICAHATHPIVNPKP